MPAFSTIALFCTVLGLTLAGAPAGYAHEPETVKLVFQHAIPNILKTRVGAVLPLADARDAHMMLEGRRPPPRGKIILNVETQGEVSPAA
jgi:hypothetical protein